MKAPVFLLLLATPAAAVQFRQPAVGNVTVTAYYDLGGTRDWNCGDNTYGGHRGTDIAIIGRFEAQDQGREIVAAAPGRVITTHDGEFDRCTTGNCGGGGGFGNYVSIQHDDGKVTYYGHMRQGSVSVAAGDQVACGQHLGLVGSSGNSTGPHVHFEMRVNGTADDPFSGPCGGPLSYWVDQGPYRGLPVDRCEVAEPPPPPPGPDMHLGIEWTLAGRPCDFEDCRDFVRDGRSGGVPDAWVGEEATLIVQVRNQGNGSTHAERPEDAAVELQYALPPGVTPVRYTIETDHPAYDRATWQRNDAMDNPANPAADAPPREGVLRLNGFSANEAKRLVLTVRVEGRNIGVGGRPEARAWIRHLGGIYGEKTEWDDPVEVNDRQTFNGGDLKVAAGLDTFDQRSFLFDSPDDEGQVEGFRRCTPDAVAGFHLNLEEHALAVEVVGADPCLESPPIRVPAAEVPGIRLRVRQHQGPRRGYVEWTTEAEPDFADSRRVAFDSTGGGAWDDVHLGPGWTGVITRVRVLPVPDAGDGSPWFDLAEVRLVAEAPVPETPGAGGAGGGAGGAGGSGGVGPDGPGRDAGVLPDPTPFDGGSQGGAGGAAPRATGTTLSGGCQSTPGRPHGGWLALVGLAFLSRRVRHARPGRVDRRR